MGTCATQPSVGSSGQGLQVLWVLTVGSSLVGLSPSVLIPTVLLHHYCLTLKSRVDENGPLSTENQMTSPVVSLPIMQQDHCKISGASHSENYFLLLEGPARLRSVTCQVLIRLPASSAPFPASASSVRPWMSHQESRGREKMKPPPKYPA